MNRKEFKLFVFYLIFFAFVGSSFVLFFPIIASTIFGGEIVCAITSSKGFFCYNLLPGQTIYSPAAQINWPFTMITWTVDLTFLFGGAFVVLKAYHLRLKALLG
jgi:hypothetical protein